MATETTQTSDPDSRNTRSSGYEFLIRQSDDLGGTPDSNRC